MKQIAIFASGNGSNAKELIHHFNHKNNKVAKISLIITNNSKAGVLEIAKTFNIKTVVLDREEFYNTDSTINILSENHIDLILLGGFLWLIPQNIIKQYRDRIINIHPALLPKFGGKGMHGMNVHRAVIAAQEKETGITIHFVNEEYDKGEIILQAKCHVEENDTAEDIEHKVQKLEHDYFSKTIENLLLADLKIIL